MAHHPHHPRERVSRFAPEIIRGIVAYVREFGVLNLAAQTYGVSPGDLKREMSADPDLAAEIEEAMAMHTDALYVHALQRATAGKSDTIMAKLLDARVPGFAKDTREAEAKKHARPTAVLLRTFKAEGDDVQDVEAKPVDSAAAPRENPGPTLLIELHRGL